MTLKYFAGNRITGLSSDTKPTTNLPIGYTFFETDTLITYYWNGTTWTGITIDASDIDIADLGGFTDVVKGGTGAITLTGWLKGNGTDAITSHTSSVVEVLDRSVASQDINTTAVETSIYSFSVPANTLSTNRMLRLSLICDYLNNSGTTKFITLKVKYGATTLYSDTTNTIATDASRHAVYMVILLAANNATNDQVLGGYVNLGDAGGTTSGLGDFADDEIMAHTAIGGESAEDSTLAKTFTVTITHSASDALTSFRRHVAILELV
jgi:hypothetical protein